MSHEIALAAADLATVESLRARILEWEDAYDRLAGAFDLHMAVCAFDQALADYTAPFYDVVLGAMAERAAQAEADVAAMHHAITIALPTLDRLGDSQIDAVAEHLEAWRDKGTPGAALLAERARLIAALAPFAAWARLALDQASGRGAALRDDDIVFRLDTTAIRVGDLRRAVAALSQPTGKDQA